MIKEFFVKLTSNWRERPEMRETKINETMRRNQEESIRVKEEEEMRKRSLREDGVTPRIDMSRPTDPPKNHEQTL